MGKHLVSNELWTLIEPLLPPEPATPKGGRPRVPARAALTGIVFVLRTGIPRKMLPYGVGVRLGRDGLRHGSVGQRAAADRITGGGEHLVRQSGAAADAVGNGA